MSNLVRMLKACVIAFLTDTKLLRFSLTVDNFKFTFLSRRQLESLSFDKFFSTVFKMILSQEVFLVT